MLMICINENDVYCKCMNYQSIDCESMGCECMGCESIDWCSDRWGIC